MPSPVHYQVDNEPTDRGCCRRQTVPRRHHTDTINERVTVERPRQLSLMIMLTLCGWPAEAHDRVAVVPVMGGATTT